MITNDRFDIASLIPAEMVDIGVTCLKNEDDTILGHVNIRFNTLFRFAIKHAYKNNEPRNLYNLSFHYSNMIQEYIKADSKTWQSIVMTNSNFMQMTYTKMLRRTLDFIL